MIKPLPPDYRFPALKDADVTLVEMIVDGLNNAQIAHQLGITEGSVKNRISAILRHVSMQNRTELAVTYLRAKMAQQLEKADS